MASGRITWLDPCPDSVWEQLPGGPVALNPGFGEVWQYTGTVVVEAGPVRHEFRHRAHPGYSDARVYAHVHDEDAGPRLARLWADGHELALLGEQVDELSDARQAGTT